MTNWTPDLTHRSGPLYRAIADAMAEDVAHGRLTPGTRLPPQRDLAWRLKVTLGTVTRAYQEASRRGLVGGEVGRGTFVLEQGPPRAVGTEPDGGMVDFCRFTNVQASFPAALTATLRRLADENVELSLASCDSLPHEGRYRQAAESWFHEMHGLSRSGGLVALTAGAQSGMFAALSAVARTGDTVLVEQYCYAGLRWIEDATGIVLAGVALDGEGLVPDAFDNACRRHAPRAVVLTPTLQHPTTVTMSEARRREVGDIARRHGVLIVENDSLRFLRPGSPPPLAATHPDVTVLVSSFGKVTDGTLRLGYMVAPEHLRKALKRGLIATVRDVSPLFAEIATRWIADGTAARLAAEQRAECAARLEILRAHLGPWLATTDPCLFAWVRLPEGVAPDDVATRAQIAGVRVLPSTFFAIGGDPSPAVRVTLGTPRTREAVARGAALLRDVIARRDNPDETFV